MRILMASDSRTRLLDLYDQYAPALYGLLLRILKDPSQADHLLERTFVKVGEVLQSNQLPPATNRLSWLLTLARSICNGALNNDIIFRP